MLSTSSLSRYLIVNHFPISSEYVLTLLYSVFRTLLEILYSFIKVSISTRYGDNRRYTIIYLGVALAKWRVFTDFARLQVNLSILRIDPGIIFYLIYPIFFVKEYWHHCKENYGVNSLFLYKIFFLAVPLVLMSQYTSATDII